MNLNIYTLEKLARSRQEEQEREMRFVETYKLYQTNPKKYSLTILGYSLSIERIE
ncbi:hypothetical protein AB1K84_09255 [Mesobacillus foraminis]|uniref:hypothetical protein n=1 Tax=Mesobacillus foraminis TaxID=279826 RepID=UPI0039A36CB5